jgi:hypothetical protein
MHPRLYRRTENRQTPSKLQRLAAEIDRLSEKDEELARRARELEVLRVSAAVEIHGACAEFVAGLNRLLERVQLTLDPPEYGAQDYRDDVQTLFQIAVSGRIVEIQFGAASDRLSTEDFRVPYALSGFVRAFSQALLDRNLIEEHLLFYTVERDRAMWRYYDGRTHRTGRFDEEYLISLVQQLL